MWKILTIQIRGEIYYLLRSHRLFPKGQKGRHRGTRETSDLLYIGQHIVKKNKVKQKDLAMMWIEYKKADDIDLQTWIIDCLKMYKISEKVIKFIMETMKKWNLQQEVKIQRGIFQGDMLLPLLCVIAIMPLNYIR